MNSSTTEYPNNLTAAEYHELTVGSAIHPSLIERNFSHIEGETVYDYLFISPTIPRKNAGRVTDGFLRAYQYVTAGGIWISGLDPQQNWRPMEWGRFKPTNPRIDLEKGKPVKYESPPKTPNRVTYFDVSDYVWDLVAGRYNIKRYHSPLALRLQDKYFIDAGGQGGRGAEGQFLYKSSPLLPLSPVPLLCFWEWVQQHPEIPIILCEGEKKAACLLSLGFVAIALPGIWNGRVGQKDFNERLHPDLLPLAQPGRKFQILFDYETKLKTRWSVFQATIRTGIAIEAAGCVCEVALLPGPEKGVDDFVVKRGENANALLTAIANDALSLKDYQSSFLVKHRGLRKYKPNIIVNVKYLTQALLVKEEERRGAEGLGGWGENLLRDSPTPDQSIFSASIYNSESSRSNKKYKLKKAHNPQPKHFFFPRSGLVVLISDMGTGKTELMRQWRDAHPDERFLNNGHRVNLLKNLAVRLETAMYSELGYVGMTKATALSITIDSLHKLNTQALTYGCIFIDEACQYLTHLLLSKTCKEHRAAILEVLHYIVYNAPLVVIADAHMDDVTIDFFRAMRPVGEQPMIIKNEWQNGDRTIYWYEGDNSSALVAQISAALMAGQKIMVVSDSKRFIKKLEQSLTVQLYKDEGVGEEAAPEQKIENQTSQSINYPQSPTPLHSHTPTPLRIWSIHSDNSGSEENVAFIKDITNAVKNLDALFTSPSLGTGVDIPDYHFDLVFGVFHGVSQTATECAQQLWRYRPKVPLHVWVAPKPPFGYLDTNATKIREQLLQTNEMTAFLLRIDRETGKRGAEKDWALDAYCQIKAARHQSLNNLRADLRSLLSDMGNQIVPVGDENDAQAGEYLKNAAVALDTAHNHAVSRANNISKTEYRSRQTKDYLSPEEINECEKFRIYDAYGMEVTESLVEKDNGGRLIAAIASLEGIFSPPSEIVVDSSTNKQYPTPPVFVSQKDRTERDNLPFCMDWGNYSAKWLARFNLGLHDILKRLVAGEEITSHDPHLLNMTAIALNCAAHIKAILGFTIPSNCQPIWLLGVLLDQLGLKLSYRKLGPRGQQVKIFSLSQEELEFALQVIAHRQAKRAEKEAQYHAQYSEQEAGGQGAGGRGQSLYKFSPLLPAPRSLSSFESSVFTPPHDGIGNPHHQGVDTTVGEEDKEQGAGRRGEIFSPLHPAPCPPASPVPDRINLLHCVEILRSGIAQGVEAIKGILRRWAGDWRWQTVLELEAIAPHELRGVEVAIPEFYALLSEEVLPMSDNT